MAAKNKHTNWKTIIKIVLLTVLTSGIIIAGISVGVIMGKIDTSSSLSLDGINLDFTSVVYYEDENGNEVEYENLYQSENRVWVDFAEIPEHIKTAAVAIEDERFYNHIGFDIKSTAYATYNYIFKKSSNRGASTITQQLVKNLTGNTDKSPIRKIKEIIQAISLEKKLSKDEILELYLNSIYLGHSCNGIGSAADYYFDKDVCKLTIAEGAAIIGITQYPSLYDPIANPDKNKEKQELVLYKMHQLGYITDTEYNDAVSEQLVFKGKEKTQNVSAQSYFVDALVNEVLQDLQTECGYTEAVASKMLYTGGLKIYCTVDPTIQNIMDKVYKDEKSFAKAPTEIQPQSSMTVIDPHTGYIRGIVGGRGEKTADRVLNRASQTKRQPGSSIKPIAVYGPAIDIGITSPGSIWEDKKVTYGNWSPKNYSGRFSGPVTVRYAIQQSLNTVAVQILHKMGVSTSYNYLTSKLGISTLTENDKNLAALALGGLSNGVTNLEMTAAYGAFANEGVYIEPVTYTKILSHTGKLIYEKQQEKTMAFSKDTASIMTSMLKSVVTSGTGTSAYFSGGYDIAGKTGTTDDDKDRWFVGMTPYYVGAVWVGYDTPKALSFFPTNPATKAWKLVMSEIHKEKKLPAKTFSTTISKYKYVTICADSGLLAGPDCENDVRGSRLRSDYFLPGTAPTTHCTYHHITKTETEETKQDDEEAQKTENSSQSNHTTPPATTVTPSHGDTSTSTVKPENTSENGL